MRFQNFNKSTTCRCQRLALGCLIGDKESKSKKGHSSEKKNELSPLIIWIALWIVNIHSQFQVNIFSNDTGITKCPKKKSKLKKGQKSGKKKIHFELSPLMARIAFWILYTYPEFQVNIFSHKRDITKCRSFCMATTPMMTTMMSRL